MESARSQNMTKGAGTCWQQEDDDGFQIWLEPPRLHDPKPFTDSERAQRWRLSLASLLFLTVLLSDHLWFCAEAKLARTWDKLASPLLLSPSTPSAQSSLRDHIEAIFLDNTTKPLCEHHHYEDTFSKNYFTLANVDHLCGNISDKDGTWAVNISGLYLSFCNSYSLLDLLQGSTRPDRLNCSLDALHDGPDGKCSLCVAAYQRYDLHAQEKYEDFEQLALKYEPGPFSVRTCMEQCKVGHSFTGQPQVQGPPSVDCWGTSFSSYSSSSSNYSSSSRCRHGNA